MNRRITISLLLLVVISLSLLPMVTLHFCMGELRSYSTGAMHDTCCASNDLYEDTESEKSFFENSYDCCSDQQLEIVTDNFISSDSNIDLKPIAINNFITVAIIDYLSDLFVPNLKTLKESQQSLHWLYKNTLTFLSTICIYRL